jgi:hypothetical protein
MHVWKRRAARPGAVWLAVTALTAGLLAEAPHVASGWRDAGVSPVVDGNNAEWPKLQELPDGPAVGVVNNADVVDVIVSASSQQLRRELANGVILWFDPARDEKQTFGVGLPPAAAAVPETAPPSGSRREGALIAPPVSQAAAIVDHVDIFGPGRNERRLVRLDQPVGIRAASSATGGLVIFELELPLMKSAAHPYAVGSRAGATLDFGLTTPDRPKSEGPRPPAGGGGWSGGVGGFGGRNGGIPVGRRGLPPPDEGPRLQPLKLWASLELAAQP